MRAEFSEFTYGFAITYEIIETVRALLPPAPELPSLVAEGSLGYDVRLDGLEGWTFLAQYKIPERMVRANAGEWSYWNKPYFRFHTHDDSDQHELLMNLEAASVFNMVNYVVPRFSDSGTLNSAFISRAMEYHSLKLRPSEIGYGDHAVTFDDTACRIYSEPRDVSPSREPIVSARSADSVSVQFSSDAFRTTTESMIETVRSRSRVESRAVETALLARRRAQSDRGISETAEAFAELEIASRLTLGAQAFAIPNST